MFVYTYIHTYTHTYIHTYIHTYTHMPEPGRLCICNTIFFLVNNYFFFGKHCIQCIYLCIYIFVYICICLGQEAFLVPLQWFWFYFIFYFLPGPGSLPCSTPVILALHLPPALSTYIDVTNSSTYRRHELVNLYRRLVPRTEYSSTTGTVNLYRRHELDVSTMRVRWVLSTLVPWVLSTSPSRRHELSTHLPPAMSTYCLVHIYI